MEVEERPGLEIENASFLLPEAFNRTQFRKNVLQHFRRLVARVFHLESPPTTVRASSADHEKKYSDRITSARSSAPGEGGSGIATPGACFRICSTKVASVMSV